MLVSTDHRQRIVHTPPYLSSYVCLYGVAYQWHCVNWHLLFDMCIEEWNLSHTNTHTYRQTHTHTDRQTHTYRQADRQTDRHTDRHTPVLVSEDTLFDGDKTFPLGSVNKSDELVPTLPSCSDEDSFDAPLATLDCSIAVDVNAFCGLNVFVFNSMFNECAPIMAAVELDVVVGLSDILMGCISDVSFINKLLDSPMAVADVDGIGVDTGLEFVLLFPPPLVELLVADDNEFPEAADDGADICCCCCCSC